MGLVPGDIVDILRSFPHVESAFASTGLSWFRIVVVCALTANHHIGRQWNPKACGGGKRGHCLTQRRHIRVGPRMNGSESGLVMSTEATELSRRGQQVEHFRIP